jgi:outer membrane protein OmpA-like peptidoglycan-associated protein
MPCDASRAARVTSRGRWDMRGEYDDEDDYYSDDRRGRKWVAGALTIAIVGLAVGGFLYLRADNEDRSFRPAASPTASTSTEPVPTTDSVPGTRASTVASAPTTTVRIDAPTTTSAPAVASTSSTVAVAQLPPVNSAPPSTSLSTSPSTSPPSSATSTSHPPTQPSTALPARPTSDGPVPTLPDGSPVPIVVVFDLDTITITGEVPSEASATRLETLALANSKTPAVVVSNMVVNPNVPISVGVRVIELNSVRFPESSAVVKLQHAAELNRVANIMQALPNISVLVVGHADQRGTEKANFAISDARARAVVNYLISTGVSADRLSSRAVGSTDLLSINDDDTAFALNRRTEFIFYGLLIE